MRKLPKTFLLLCLAGTALSLPARADEVPPVVEALLHNFESHMGGAKPTYDSIETDDSGTITISKLKFAASEGQAGAEATIDEVSLEDVTDQGDGKFEIGTASTTGTAIAIKSPDGQNVEISIPEMTMEGWLVRTATENPTPEEAFLQSMAMVKKVSSGKITVTAMGQSVSADGVESTWDGDTDTGAGKFSAVLKNLVIPAALLDMTGAGPVIKQLGYGDIALDLGADGAISVGDGKVGYDFSTSYTAKDMGNIKISFNVADLPIAVFAEMEKAQKSGQPPDFNALMPELQNVSFNSAALRFEDNSITKKLLPMMAAMSGMDEATMIASAGPMMQMGLMQLNNPEFATQVTDAVNAFLKDPKSLTVTLKPASPVKVMDLMGISPADPGAAIKLLGVSVSAND